MANRKALVARTMHTPTGFLVFNAGKVTKDIPDDMLGRLEAEGVIEKPAARTSGTTSGTKKSGAKRRSTKAAKGPAGAANKSGATASGAAVTPNNASNAGIGTGGDGAPPAE